MDIKVVCDQSVVLTSWLQRPVEIRSNMVTDEQVRQNLELKFEQAK